MRTVKIKFNEPVQYGVKFFDVNEIGLLPESEALALINGGLKAEIVKEENKAEVKKDK